MTNIDNFLNDIKIQINEGNYIKASESYIEAISISKKESSPILESLYLDYAYFLFDLHEYELSLKMFISAFNLNYQKDEILDFIYDSFIIPNLNEFKNTFTLNTSLHEDKILYSHIPVYEDLPIDFIPFADEKYYIFNKINQKFEGILDYTDENLSAYNQITLKDEFSDIIIEDNWNICYIHNHLLTFKDRIIYYLSSHPFYSLSFLKLPNIINKYLNNVVLVQSIDMLQEYFHSNTFIYLPRNIFSFRNVINNELNDMIEKEHTYRLTPNGRNTDNVLLTIGIPSYNRGHRALSNILQLLELPYDAEIEFVVSDNCSDKNTEGYEEIKKLQDSRIKYFKFPNDPGKNNNFCQVIDMANGKFTCLLSDEDTINQQSLSHYLAVFKSNNNLSFIKSKGIKYYNENTGKIFSKGKDALLKSFLTTNYISGLIYRTDIFHSNNVYSWISSLRKDNYAAKTYAHSCYSILYALKGDYLEDNQLLIIEGADEKDSIFTEITKKTTTNKIVRFSTVENRLKQHNGFIEVLNQLSHLLDNDTYIEVYKALCRKTFFLISLVKSNYIEVEDDWNKICLDVNNCCINGIKKMNISLSIEEQNELANYINKFYEYCNNNNIL